MEHTSKFNYTLPEAQRLRTYLEPLMTNFLRDLTELCAIDAPTYYTAGIEQVLDWVKRYVQERNWQVQDWPDEQTGGGLIISVPGGTPTGPRALLVTHLDTVYPVGTASERPVHLLDDRYIGPGVSDNRGGLLSALYALSALQATHLLAPFGRVSLVCCPDEEVDMRVATAMLEAFAPSYDLALVIEPARENGAIVNQRKGSAVYVLEVLGRAAHAGIEPHKGAHAILALAQQVVALQALNGLRPGITVNVGVIEGGTTENVVPERARARIDVRMIEAEDDSFIHSALEQIALSPYVPGTTASLTRELWFPPLSPNPSIIALTELAQQCADELGFVLQYEATGGISLANILAGYDLPVLDGLGPVGGLEHSPGEYMQVSSIVPRISLLCLLLYRYAQNARKEEQQRTS